MGGGLIVAALIALVAAPARAAETQLVHSSTAYADSAGKALKSPEGVTCSEDGRVVVADTGNARLVTYQFKNGALEGGAVVKLDGVDSPMRVELDSKGGVVALDRKSRRLVRVGADGKQVGAIELKGVPAANGLVPVAFKLDRNDNLYVLDIASARVVVANGEGTFQRQLELPQGALVTDIAVDARGVLYAVDAKAAIVYSAQKGASLKPLSPSLKGYMNFPAYVTASSRGGLVLVDRNGNGIVQLGPDGSYKGRQLSIGAVDGALYYPEQICVTSRGEIFVADRGNQRVQAFVAGK